MKPRVILSVFPALLVVFMIAGAQKAAAEDVHIGVGVGVSGGNNYRYHDYRTSDSSYGTWYPSTTVYGGYSGSSYYGGGYYGNSYSTPYVYATPSVQFNTWYGDGYHSGHGGSYSGNGYYGGGYRSSGRSNRR